MDILDRIDEVTAPVCGTCTEPLDPAGPSMYFCDDRCSDSWHRTQGEPLVGYREPWHRPGEFPGVGMDEYSTTPETPSIAIGGGIGFRVAQPTITSSLSMLRVEWPVLEFRLPRETANLAADWAAARIAEHAATTVAQRAAVRLRLESLVARQRIANAERDRIMAAAFEPMRSLINGMSAAFLDAARAMQPFFDGLRRAGVIDESSPADPRERALAARRNRGTGPAPRGRAPRSTGQASTSARR